MSAPSGIYALRRRIDRQKIEAIVEKRNRGILGLARGKRIAREIIPVYLPCWFMRYYVPEIYTDFLTKATRSRFRYPFEGCVSTDAIYGNSGVIPDSVYAEIEHLEKVDPPNVVLTATLDQTQAASFTKKSLENVYKLEQMRKRATRLKIAALPDFKVEVKDASLVYWPSWAVNFETDQSYRVEAYDATSGGLNMPMSMLFSQTLYGAIFGRLPDKTYEFLKRGRAR